jgi:hypothetical protein
VTIPGGGDLAPLRRRRYGGSYGRRRHRRNLQVALAVLLAAAVAGGVYLLRADDTKARDRVSSQQPCTTPTLTAPSAPSGTTASPAPLPKPQQVRLVLLNGTSRNGLAKTIGDQLAAQGFVVTAQANAPAALSGASTVSYGPTGAPAATVLSRWVVGSRLVPSPAAPRGSVTVVLGSAFQRLATPAEAAAADRPVATPSAAPAAVPTGCPA